MTDTIKKIKIDNQSYEFEIKDGYEQKTGYFCFENGWNVIQVGFKADEYGNIQELHVIEARDGDGDLTDFVITDEIRKTMIEQIEPLLWNDDPEEEPDSMKSLGFTNSDFLYGY